MNSETRTFIGIIVATIFLIVGGAFLFSSDNGTSGSLKIDSLVENDSYATGSATPKVTVVEFSDFECPSCIVAYPVVENILAKYSDKVKVYYRQFPLPQHTFAQKAAEASEIAGVNGKFWSYLDLLFKADGNLSEADLLKMASGSGLNVNDFSSDLKSGKYADKVSRDVAAGNRLQVNATPTFFVNGKRVVGGDNLLAEVEGALK